MKKIILLVWILFGSYEISQGQHLKKNRFEVNSFQNRAPNTIGSESTRATGINFGYTRYLLKRLNIGAAYGFGTFSGRGSILLERFDDFPELKRDYRQFQIKLGYDVIQAKNIVLGFQAEYLRHYYNGVSLRITEGQPGDSNFKESLSFGRIITPAFYTGAYMMAKIHNQVYLKGDASYGWPGLNFDYELLQLSVGVAVHF